MLAILLISYFSLGILLRACWQSYCRRFSGSKGINYHCRSCFTSWDRHIIYLFAFCFLIV